MRSELPRDRGRGPSTSLSHSKQIELIASSLLKVKPAITFACTFNRQIY
jgi:hypothetical protein